MRQYMMMDDEEGEKLKQRNNTWRVDDLDGGLVTGLSKLHGLGSQKLMEESNPAAYNMTEVLQLQLFKDDAVLDSSETTADLLQSLNRSLQESLNSDLLQSLDNSLQDSLNDSLQYSQPQVLHNGGPAAVTASNVLNHSLSQEVAALNALAAAVQPQQTSTNINSLASFQSGNYIMTSAGISQLEEMTSAGISQLEEKPDITMISAYTITLKAPTAPGRKLDEETLTWLNQGQSYEIILQCNCKETFQEDMLIKSTLTIGFQERQHQYFEFEKYEEWVCNRPNEKMIELDRPMCWGIQTPLDDVPCTNQIEFQWSPAKDAGLFVKVNCLSSEFTKGKGESGIPLRLQLELFNSAEAEVTDEPGYVAGCQVKVFRAKGANRKLRIDREKYDNLSKEQAGNVQQSYDCTIFKRLTVSDRIHKKLSQASTKTEMMCGISPTRLGQLTIVNSSNNNSVNSVCTLQQQQHCTLQQQQQLCTIQQSIPFSPNPPICTNLSANSNVDETQSWLRFNRFQNYTTCFSNFTGADLLRLSRNDLIQLCGPADGIRLNNALQARASRPLLTMYVSPEWHQSETGMREYHAMFLEQLTTEDLKRKLATKCGIEEGEISALLKQGPTGIHIHVDDELVRNFVDEAHHVVEVIKDPQTGLLRILLK